MDDELEVSLLSKMQEEEDEEEEDMVYARYARRERKRYKSDNERYFSNHPATKNHTFLRNITFRIKN